MRGHTTGALLLALVLLGSAMASGVALAAPQQAVFLSVEVTTTPDQPTTEDTFDLHVTVTNAEGATTNAYVRRMALVNSTEGDRETYVTNYSIGQAPPGYSLSHTMPVDLDEEGTHDLFLDMTVEAGGKTYRVYEPVTIRVYDGHPVVEATAPNAVAGAFTELNLTIGNGLDGPIRNVNLLVSSEEVTIDQPRRVLARVDDGGTHSFSFRAKAASPGEKTVAARIAYTNASGERRHVTRHLSVGFADPTGTTDVAVAARLEPALPGAETSLNVSLSNGHDVAIRQLRLSIAGEGVTIPQPERVDGQIASGESRTYTFAVSREETGPQTFEATLSYTLASGTTRTVTKSLQAAFSAPENPGDVTLTGIDVERDGQTLTVSGTASNVGGGDVSGVTVAVASNADVAPGRSQSDFFVGSIPASDFVSFDVNARLTSNATTAEIPLVVSYTVDDVRIEETMTVHYAGEPASARESSGGGFPFGTLVGALVLLVLVGGGVYYWRRRR
ncbi:MAG: hypothetical protein ABEJ67_03200 [Halanaeroarchaeum sp.]